LTFAINHDFFLTWQTMPGQKRQFAAIMFTDIVGYTALMGKDSAKALELVRISKEIQKPLVETHKGKWL
jgi:class 3 adenylate cyclase